MNSEISQELENERKRKEELASQIIQNNIIIENLTKERKTLEGKIEILTNQLEIANTKICITTDLKQNASNLSNSLSEFVIDEATGKYKMQEVNLKILE